MKRLILAVIILGAGATIFLNAQKSNARTCAHLTVDRESLSRNVAVVEQLVAEQSALNGRVRELKREAARLPQITPADAKLLALVEQGGEAQFSESARERLFEELGFDWHASTEYLVVSKETLRDVGIVAVHNNQLTDTLCAVLDIRPAEQAALDSALRRINAEHKAWVMANALREEPSGDIVAHYRIPANPEMGLSWSNALASAASTPLGDDRAGLFMAYARRSTHQSALLEGSESTLKIRRYMAGGSPRLDCELRYQNSTMSSGVTRHQPFPEAFRPLFPGGWKELADREGFDLPAEFNQP